MVASKGMAEMFSKRTIERLLSAGDLEEVIDILQPWIGQVAGPSSRFMQEVASYLLRPLGRSYIPSFFKRLVAGEVCRLTTDEDLRSVISLAIVESYREYSSAKGCDLVTWLAARIPYRASRWVTFQVTHPIGPVDIFVDPVEPKLGNFERQLDIIGKELKLSNKQKAFYGQKREE